MKKRVIIDTDPGIDDALALLFAQASRELQIEAVTTVAGNIPLTIATANALRVLDMAKGNNIPVYAGSEGPILKRLSPATRIHGEDGLGECQWPASDRSAEEKSAVDLMIERATLFPGELTLICLGPLTNLALAIERDPDAIAKFQEIIIMGGAAKVGGNVTPVAEFNFWADPEAASAVLQWAKVPITLVGLDVTRQVLFTPAHRELLNQLATPLSKWICKITRHYLDASWQLESKLGCALNDPLAVAVAFMPGLVEAPLHSVDVACDGLCRGQLVLDENGIWKKRKNVRVALSVDHKAFLEEFLVRLVPEKLTRQELRSYLG